MPPLGMKFSASIGRTLEEAGAGVPHGMIRSTSVGEIRGAGGMVEYAPEFDVNFGKMNRQHVHVLEAGNASIFGAVTLNPVAKRRRIGGPEYLDPDLFGQGATK